jgi:hypothetical protein
MLWGLILSCVLCSSPRPYEDTGWWDSESWWRDSGSTCEPWISVRDAEGERADAVDFGTLSEAVEVEQALSIENKGDCELQVHDIYVLDSDGPFGTTALDWPIIDPGSSAQLLVTFTPTESGSYEDTLVIVSDDPFAERVEIELQGVMSSGGLRVDPESVDFGAVEVGCDADQDLTLSNPGPGPVTISAIELSTGSDELSAAWDTVPATLEADETLTLRVAYTPTDTFEDVGYVTITSTDPAQPELLVQVEGQGAYAGEEVDEFTQSGASRVFVLTEVAVESTIEVRVEGVIAGGWSFDSSANAVVFDEGNVPSEGATIDVSYARQAICTDE